MFCLAFTVLIMFSGLVSGQEASIELDYENSKGLSYGDNINTGWGVELHLRYNNQYNCAYMPANAFKLYTTDGADWSNFEGVSLCPGDFCNSFDTIIISYGPGGNDGPPLDEVGFAGLLWVPLPAG
jgi:hypothetical protein